MTDGAKTAENLEKRVTELEAYARRAVAKAIDAAICPGTVTARRIEIVDASGRVRVVVGDMSPELGDSETFFGIKLCGADGSDQGEFASGQVAVDEYLTEMLLTHEGNIGLRVSAGLMHGCEVVVGETILARSGGWAPIEAVTEVVGAS